MPDSFQTTSTVEKISGPVVTALNLPGARLNDVVFVGNDRLIGEIIRLEREFVTIQVYEETSGLALGEPVVFTSEPLSVDLGPGLLGTVYDGLQRPLYALAQIQGEFIQRGQQVSCLDESKKWKFVPIAKPGKKLTGGDVIGYVEEKKGFLHPIFVPPAKEGHLLSINEGEFTVVQEIATLALGSKHTEPLFLSHHWPVRIARPKGKALSPQMPLITGTRVIDLLFPLAKGGSAIIPGGFGTGKTVLQQSISRWADVDIVVYVGCGERGNEMAEVLSEFPKLIDPRSGSTLMDRTVLIANTSNMPVAAREASIYTGITIAEYYRDMGYDVLLLADSTSRWAEALREISGRLEEIPGEEGFPAYLSSRLAAFYERSGIIETGASAAQLTKRTRGSISIIGAVSPPGADFSEPVTQDSMRVAGAFWALDYDLSRRRHFPAINWIDSYSLYAFDSWYQSHTSEQLPQEVAETKWILRKENELMEIVQIIGQEGLSITDRLLLFTARLIREDLLQQYADDPVDRYSPLDKSSTMLSIILLFHHLAQRAIEAQISFEEITSLPLLADISGMKNLEVNCVDKTLSALKLEINETFENLISGGKSE